PIYQSRRHRFAADRASVRSQPEEEVLLPAAEPFWQQRLPALFQVWRLSRDETAFSQQVLPCRWRRRVVLLPPLLPEVQVPVVVAGRLWVLTLLLLLQLCCQR